MEYEEIVHGQKNKERGDLPRYPGALQLTKAFIRRGSHLAGGKRFYSEGELLVLPAANQDGKADVVVSGKRSLEAAESYIKQGKRVCVLNFASATNPGGGVINGSSAQEECLCRCSTLYPCLSADEIWDSFYGPHRKTGNPLNNGDCIYTPEVLVFKSDTDFPEPLPETDWWPVNILTCAAPNLRERPSNRMNPGNGCAAAQISAKQLRELLRERIRRIFTIAAIHENQVLILGAFGCGAFRNPPDIVADAFYSVMQEFPGHFETIEYAVYCTQRDRTNLEVFRRVMQ